MTLKEFVDRNGADTLPAEIEEAENALATPITIVHLRALCNYANHKGLSRRVVDFFTIAHTDKGLRWYIVLRK